MYHTRSTLQPRAALGHKVAKYWFEDLVQLVLQIHIYNSFNVLLDGSVVTLRDVQFSLLTTSMNIIFTAYRVRKVHRDDWYILRLPTRAQS